MGLPYITEPIYTSVHVEPYCQAAAITSQLYTVIILVEGDGHFVLGNCVSNDHENITFGEDYFYQGLYSKYDVQTFLFATYETGK